MEIIATQTSCIICKRGIARGKVAQVLDGYVCEECILKMANSDLVEVDTSYDNIDGMCKHPECHPGNIRMILRFANVCSSVRVQVHYPYNKSIISNGRKISQNEYNRNDL